MAEMSQELVRNYIETLNDNQRIFLNAFVNLNIYGLEISWDFDQVLLQTEIPVADFCDKDLGTNYAGRKIRGWNSFSKWLLEDGVVKTKEEADEYEEMIWTDPKIIKEAPPNKRLQSLSFIAWRRGILQTVTTSRIPELADVTDAQIKLHYPWLVGHVNQRRIFTPNVSGEDFKVAKIFERYQLNPNLVHLDDSMTLMKKLLKTVPGISVIGFPCIEDEIPDTKADNHVFLPDIKLFNAMVYYPEIDVMC